MRYQNVKDGDLILPVQRGYKFRCCDCGLVHRMDFLIIKRRVRFQVWRDNRATAAVRRRKR